MAQYDKLINLGLLSQFLTKAKTIFAPKITVSGILKGDGAGGVTAAVAETDYGTYSKPSTGIPKTDLASDVQTSLSKADSAYQKPSGGIPASDLASGVIPSVPSASSTTPAMNGTAAVGTGTTWARADHVHPIDTSRAAATSVPAQASIDANGLVTFKNSAGTVLFTLQLPLYNGGNT